MTPRKRQVTVVAILAIGAAAWVLIARTRPELWPQFIAAAIAIVLAVLPGVGPAAARGLDRLRQPSPRAARGVAFGIAGVAVLFLYLVARVQDRDLFPKLHDESMHLVQMQHLARGKLWMPAHPVAEAFESFHIFTTPKYAGMYFPGASLLYLPGVWLNLPHWLMPLLVCGATVGLFYRVVTDMIDGRAGLLAAAVLLACPQLQYIAVMTLSHGALIFFGMLMLLSWLRWRRARDWRWAAAVGFFAGWAAITRPLDALCYAVPIGVAMLLALRGAPVRSWLATLAALVIPALPLLALQGVQNVALAGNLFATPYQRYVDIYMPGTALGFHGAEASAAPRTKLPQWHAYHEQFTRPSVQRHTLRRLPLEWLSNRGPRVLRYTLPSTVLFIFAALGVMSMSGPRWAMLAIPLAFLAAYTTFPFLLPHYLTVAAPAAVFCVVLGIETIRDAWPRAGQRLATAAALVVLALAIASLPGIDRPLRGRKVAMPSLALNERLPGLVDEPALVLFRFGPGVSPHEEPVYNVDVAWPDDAPIVRAHDLGPAQNEKLFRYYAQRQPDRNVYVVDRATLSITPLGRVKDLAGASAGSSR